jgi:hypothetical protein
MCQASVAASNDDSPHMAAQQIGHFGRRHATTAKVAGAEAAHEDELRLGARSGGIGDYLERFEVQNVFAVKLAVHTL